MLKENTKKAVDMLLKGATMLSEPCPYCKGVRVMKDGHALCINCGREPETREIPEEIDSRLEKSRLEIILEKKIEELSKELEVEKDHDKEQEILRSINSVIEMMEKVKKQ